MTDDQPAFHTDILVQMMNISGLPSPAVRLPTSLTAHTATVAHGPGDARLVEFGRAGGGGQLERCNYPECLKIKLFTRPS